MEVEIKDIVIKQRKRPLNDIKVSSLAESIKQLGLLNPITVDEHNNLMAGRHRFEACKFLGWSTIPATLCLNGDALQAELIEIDENLIRNELTVLEQGEHLKRRDEILAEMGVRAKVGWNGNQYTDNLGRVDSTLPKTTADIASEAGLSKSTVKQRKQIANGITEEVKEEIRGTDLEDKATDLLQLSRLEPEEQKEAVKRVKGKKAKNVKQAVKQAKKEKQIESIQTTPPPVGKYYVIAIDPPWPYEKRVDDETHRGASPYPSMTIEEIKQLSIPDLSYDDCILWLWVTNAFMEQGHQIARYWGFEVKTILTWEKNQMGTGDWLRGKTEHCLMCVKGKPVVNLTNQTTIIHGPLREHSRKPDEFYKLVEELCPGVKLELFSREERNGWTRHGIELL